MAKRQSGTRRTSTKTVYQFTRNEINVLLPQYMLIRDAIDGEMAIKGMTGSGAIFPATSGLNTFSNIINVSKAKLYLPMPNEVDQSQENRDRYIAYVTRAVWYGVTWRTLEAMAGQIFLRDPDRTIPSQLNPLLDDADGAGNTLDQVAGHMTRSTIAYSRSGVLVDYPVVNAPATQFQIEKGDIRPVLIAYDPWQIINWQVTTIGARKVLTQLILCEYYDQLSEDRFTTDVARRYRVLQLDPVTGQHQVRVYEEGDDVASPSGSYQPKNSQGQPFDYIPFFFAGAKNNDPVPDRPLLYDLASMNCAHYRNSADYEEACFIAGQPTPVISGLDQNWVETVLKGKVTLGSRGAVALPVGAKLELVQAKDNSMPLEAMRLKETQMVAIGAKLVQVQKVQKTATQQINEQTSESSPLQNVSRNVSSAIKSALQTACEFIGADQSAITYALNTDFDLTSMSSDDQNAILLQWQSGAIAFPEMRKAFRRAGTAYLSDTDAKTQIKQDIKDGLIPDPAMQGVKEPNALPKTPSGAGGPQPGAPRTQPSPGTTT